MVEQRRESPVHASAKLAAWLGGRGRGVAITGASGWIGAAMSHAVLEAAAEWSPANLRLFGSRARTVTIAGRSVELEPLSGGAPLGDGEWLILHTAVIGADRIPEPRALRAANDAMLADVLALAGTGRVRRFVYASSGAVYARDPAQPEKAAYVALKRDQEAVSQAWSRSAGVPILVPRIFNVGGPYMTVPSRYALGDFILQAMSKGAIEIGARRRVLRSYVHVLEFARMTFDLALEDTPSLTFDTAGAETLEMADLAEAVGRALALRELSINRPSLDGEVEEDRYVGDGGVYRAALARSGRRGVSLDEIIRDTAAYLGASASA